ncbi:MAG: hypothetical protein QOD88_5057, partial [Mycobacterium sp.]|nr:hypothetical protein [Mycobacterium sp.]
MPVVEQPHPGRIRIVCPEVFMWPWVVCS